jgi:hypothetical protein
MATAQQFPSRATFYAHHAHLIEAGPENGRAAFEHYLEEELAFPVHGNPDYAPYVFETMYIDSARHLHTQAAQRPLTHPFSLYVVAFRSMTVEAQNALLKLVEDPGPHIRLVLIVPSADTLLPTLRSRLSYFGAVAATNDDESEAHARTFLGAGIAQRYELVQRLVQQKDVRSASALTAALEHILYEQFRAGSTHLAGPLQSVTQCRQYLHDRAPSVKMILEYLVVSIPQLSDEGKRNERAVY